MDRLFEVRAGDLIVNITFAWEGAIAIAGEQDDGCLVSHRFPTYEFKADKVDPEFFRHLIAQRKFVYQLGVISPGGAGRNRVMNQKDFLKIQVHHPKLEEQREIGKVLASIDSVILAETDKFDALSNHKSGLLRLLFPTTGEACPRLRFQQFRDGKDWHWKQLGEMIGTLTPPKKIPTSEYQAKGDIPIIDQGQKDIAGWTNDTASALTKPLPVVVFGDHTCSIKLVDFAFAQGADGIKIIRPDKSMTTDYLYYVLQAHPVNSGEYKRHFSDLKDRQVPVPNIDEGEQEAITSCLSALDKLIASQDQKVSLLNNHKAGLMQKLFPYNEKADK